jgi:hypothetical protein
MAGGVPVAFLAGMAAMYARLYCAWRVALKFAHADPAVKPRAIHTFFDDFDVEVAARIGRVFDAEGANDDPAALDVAEGVLRSGVAMWPGSPYLRIVYSNFLIEARLGLGMGRGWKGMGSGRRRQGAPRSSAGCLRSKGRTKALTPHATPACPHPLVQVRKNNASGWAQLEAARKLEPNLSYQFSIFSREQEHKQKAAAGSSGEQVRQLARAGRGGAARGGRRQQQTEAWP